LKPNLSTNLPSEGYEERTMDDDVTSMFFMNIQLSDDYETFISPELYPEEYEEGKVWVMCTHHKDGEECEVLENWSSIPKEVWEREHNKAGFREFLEEYI